MDISEIIPLLVTHSNEILAQNGEENDGEKTPWEERGGEQ